MLMGDAFSGQANRKVPESNIRPNTLMVGRFPIQGQVLHQKVKEQISQSDHPEMMTDKNSDLFLIPENCGGFSGQSKKILDKGKKMVYSDLSL